MRVERTGSAVSLGIMGGLITTVGGCFAGITVMFAGLVAAVMLAVACCFGGWLLMGTHHLWGCGHDRPDNLTSADLLGTFGGEGVRLTLLPTGEYRATRLASSGAERGRWNLLASADGRGDVDLSAGPGQTYIFQGGLHAAGTRQQPYLWEYTGDPDTCRIRRLDRFNSAASAA